MSYSCQIHTNVAVQMPTRCIERMHGHRQGEDVIRPDHVNSGTGEGGHDDSLEIVRM